MENHIPQSIAKIIQSKGEGIAKKFEYLQASGIQECQKKNLNNQEGFLQCGKTIINQAEKMKERLDMQMTFVGLSLMDCMNLRSVGECETQISSLMEQIGKEYGL